jgi:hypothetical protein
MHSKVFLDWLPSYITATRPVLEIFKMAGYFPDSPRISFTRQKYGFHSTNFHENSQTLLHCFTEIFYADIHPNRPTAMEKDGCKLVFTNSALLRDV